MRFDDIPLLDGGDALLGHMRHLSSGRLELMAHAARTQLDLVRIRFPAQTVVAANGPEVVREVLVSKARNFEKSPMLRTSLYPLAGDGLFTSEGSLWRRQRKLMSPMFRVRDLGTYADAMAACAERTAATWRDGEVVDIARETTRIAMSIAGKTLFDADTFSHADELGDALTTALDWVNGQLGSPLLIAQARSKTALMIASHHVPPPLSLLLKRASEALHRPLIVPGAAARELRNALDVLERHVADMIAVRRADTNPRTDLLTQLLHARGEDGAQMDDKQVRDEILTLFIAGHETTASGLAWSLYLLARDEAAYRTATAEARALPSGRVGLDALAQLPYCLKVFKEALRMYAPIYLFGRQAIAPTSLGGYDVPRGKIVLLSPYAMHHRADLWPDPARFDPNRFDPEAEQARPREAYMPFSGGPRTCIGNHFALMEGPIVLATLLRHAKLTLDDHEPVVPEASATLRPKDGIPMRVTLAQPAPSLVEVTC